MPRPIFTPLSGRDRRFSRKQLRLARGHYAAKMREAEDARAADERYIRVADKAFCEAWHAAMFAGGPAQPSSTIAMAIGGGFTALEVKCARCNRERLVDLADIQRPPSTYLWQLEASLNCSPCRSLTGWHVHTGPDDPNAPAAIAAL